MNKETEIKLRVSRETLAALRDHPLLKKRNNSGWEQRELFNQYFDTPSRDLAAAKVALRLRRDGEQFIQTLKTRGQSVAGLSERNEWDWYLAKAKLDLKKLDDSCWPAALAEFFDRPACHPSSSWRWVTPSFAAAEISASTKSSRIRASLLRSPQVLSTIIESLSGR